MAGQATHGCFESRLLHFPRALVLAPVSPLWERPGWRSWLLGMGAPGVRRSAVPLGPHGSRWRPLGCCAGRLEVQRQGCEWQK